MRKVGRGGLNVIPLILAISGLGILSISAIMFSMGSWSHWDSDLFGALALVWGLGCVGVLVFFLLERGRPATIGRPMSFVLLAWIMGNFLGLVFAVSLSARTTGISSDLQESILYATFSIGLVQVGIVSVLNEGLKTNPWGRAGRFIAYAMGVFILPAAYVLSLLLILSTGATYGT